MRSAIDMASSWSCVTTTNVSPTSCWRRFSSSCIARAHLPVERRQRLVEQQQARPLHDRAGERDALPLAARQLRGSALGEVPEADDLHDLADAAAQVRPADALGLEAVGDVLLDAEVREQGVALEHHVDRALVRRHPEQVLAVDLDAARLGRLEAGDRAQQRGLAAARRAEQGEELVVGDVERDAVQGDRVAVDGADAVDAEQGCGGHFVVPVSRVSRCAAITVTMLTSRRRVARALTSGVTPKRTIE